MLETVNLAPSKGLIIVSIPFDAFEKPFEGAAEETVSEPTISAPEEATPEIVEVGVVKEASPIEEEAALLPPEAQGETNGGPLGCCLGSVAGLFLTVLVITLISIAVTNQRYLSPGLVMVPAALLGAIVGGWIGWRIGKSIYREYELSPERRERLERIDRQWQSRQERNSRVRRAKMG